MNLEEEKMFWDNEKLIWHILNRKFKSDHLYSRLGFTREDLYQFGAVGLIKAIRDFDSSMGFKFSTYAYPKIWGEITYSIREADVGVKVPRKALTIYNNIKKREIMPTVDEIREEFGVSKSYAEDILTIKHTSVDSFENITIEGNNKKSVTLEEKLSADYDLELDVIKKIEFEDKLNMLTERNRKIMEDSLNGEFQIEIAKKHNISQVQVGRIIKGSLAIMDNYELEEAI